MIGSHSWKAVLERHHTDVIYSESVLNSFTFRLRRFQQQAMGIARRKHPARPDV